MSTRPRDPVRERPRLIKSSNEEPSIAWASGSLLSLTPSVAPTASNSFPSITSSPNKRQAPVSLRPITIPKVAPRIPRESRKASEKIQKESVSFPQMDKRTNTPSPIPPGNAPMTPVLLSYSPSPTTSSPLPYTPSPTHNQTPPTPNTSTTNTSATNASTTSQSTTPAKNQGFIFNMLMDRNSQTESSRPNTHEKKVSRQPPRAFANIARIERLPNFKDVLVADRHTLFQKKVRQCYVVFDFIDLRSDTIGKNIKSQIFVDLSEFLSENTSSFPEPTYQAVAQMVSLNLFRPLQPVNQIEFITSEIQEDIPQFDPAWPHLQLVYGFFVKFLDNNLFDPEVSKKSYDGPFASQFVDLFQSQDPRERDFVKKILYKLYAKFFSTRQAIRKAIGNSILEFVFENRPNPGMIEMLEILASIINGLSVPLKEEHVVFYERVLLSLLKPGSYVLYCSPLHSCIKNFISKDKYMAAGAMFSLLQHWPITHSLKELRFLELIQEILQKCDTKVVGQFVSALFKRIGLCIASRSYIIAERALFFWNDESLLGLITDYRSTILPLIFKPLINNLKDHWDSYIKNYTIHVMAFFIAVDEPLFRSCHAHYVQELERQPHRDERRVRMWKRVEVMCQQDPQSHSKFLKISSSLPELQSPPSQKVKLRAEYDDATQLIKKVMGTTLEPAREKRHRSPIPVNPQIIQKAKAVICAEP